MLRSLGAVLLLGAAQADGASFREWRTTQDLPVVRPGVVAVTLPGETLDAAKSGLEDLRILDPAGREVPWAPEQAPRAPSGPRPAASVETTLEDGATELRILTGLDEPLVRVELEMASWEFVKAARIEESADGRVWTQLRDGEPLFSAAGGARKTAIDLPPARRARLRITLDDRRSRPIPVTAVRVVPASPPPPVTEPVELELVERLEAPGQSRLRLRFPGRHVRLSELRIDTPELVYRRRVELSAGETVLAGDTIYRTPQEERRSFDARVLLPAREALLTIHHGDSPPLGVDRVRARVRPVTIYFMASSAGVHRVLAGNPGASAPRYDVGVLGAPGSGEAATPGALRVNPDWRPPEPLPGVIPAGASIDVGAWSHHKELRLGPGRVHEVELDPEILSASDPSGSDLRLVRGGLQIPYLRDDPPRLRPLRPSVTRDETEDWRRTSRWTLGFPRPRLPIRRLSCAVAAPLFRREVRLVEEQRDEYGVVRRTVLAGATWSRTPDRPPERLELELELDQPPRTDRLILEVENGDNPPLEIGDVEATYAAPRLVFKAESGPGVSLYYGNPRAPAPRYDLTLAAAELTSADRSAAVLGSETPESPAKRSDETPSGPGGIFFWAVLVLLTVVLLAVIVRLFPPKSA